LGSRKHRKEVRRESRKQPKQDLKSGVFYCNKSLPQKLLYLKGLGHEIDLKKFDKNGQI
jgi:hypothetical protein